MMSAEKISIHAPTRGATSYGCKPDDGYAISIHAPTRGATLPLCLIFISSGDFNPRSHKGSDYSVNFYSADPQISIHAPTREATYVSMHIQLSMVISIHAPTREATLDGVEDDESKTISIHAPTREATSVGSGSACQFKYFNPRSHKGSDRQVARCNIFQA